MFLTGSNSIDVVGAEIVSIGGFATSIKGELKGGSVVKFSASEFADDASALVVPGDSRAMDVPICLIILFSDGKYACESCDYIDIINKGVKGKK